MGAGGGAVGAGGGAVGEGVIVAPTSSRRETYAISRGNLGETLDRIGAAGFKHLPVTASVSKDSVQQQGQCGSWSESQQNRTEQNSETARHLTLTHATPRSQNPNA